MRRLLPFLAPLLVGALAYLVLGEGPASAPARAADPASWALPALATIDPAPSARVWAGRMPWGSEGPVVEQAPQVVVRPVGVVAVGDTLFALFSQGDTVVRVGKGESLADGGQVTAIRPDVVEWIDGAGATQRRELMVEIVDAAAASAQPAGRGTRASTRDAGATNRGNRSTTTRREPGQRRARSSIPEANTNFSTSRRPSTTGD